MTVDLALLLLADGRFPAGGHAHSAGTESAVRYGDVTDLASLERFLAGRLATAGRVDASFASRACTFTPTAPTVDLDRLDREYAARVASPRARTVSRQLGRQFLRAARSVWPQPWLVGDRHQPVALGLAVAAAGGAPRDAAVLAYHHLAGAVTTAAVRMLGLDPLAAAGVHARAVAALTIDPAWATADPADLPATTSTLAEILAEDHGTWDARLFVA